MSLRVRLAICFLFTVSLVGALAFRVIRGDRREIDLGVALRDPLAKVDELTAGATIVRINGVEVRRSTSYTDRSASTVLDRFESECREAPSRIDDAMKDVPRFLQAPRGPAMKDAARGVALRWNEDESGAVLCLVDEAAAVAPAGSARPDAQGIEMPYGRRERMSVDASEAELQKRLATFAKTGDLSALGRIRYLRAVKGVRTRVVTLSSADVIDLAKIFPGAGEAPGDDSSVAPRPPAARRTLSLSTENVPTAVRTYETSTGISEVAAAYDAEMRARGFKAIVTPWARFYRTEGDVEIILILARDGETTKVTLLEIDPRRRLSPKQCTTS